MRSVLVSDEVDVESVGEDVDGKSGMEWLRMRDLLEASERARVGVWAALSLSLEF